VPGTAAYSAIYGGAQLTPQGGNPTGAARVQVPGNDPVTSQRVAIGSTGITIPIVRLRKLHWRLLALIVALVQLTGPAAASLADAQLEAASNGPHAVSHIEAHGRPECARVHADDCALCQYLATAYGQPAPPAAVAPISLSAIRPPVAELLGYAPTALGALPYSRGPPALV
jgi:hypothetical protein